jgi:N6-adenosine-specific RNA methylase IME4
MSSTLPAGKFRVILADPPWTYSVFSAKGEGRSAKKHYRTMPLDRICSMPVGDMAARDCHLFLWTTGPNLPQAFQVMDAWSFRYSSVAFTWIKLRRGFTGGLINPATDFHVGMGHTTRKNAEYVLLGRRGSPKRLDKGIRELIIAPVRRHSQKPEEAQNRIERYADGPYLELFARRQRDGWTCWGDELPALPEAAE